MTIKYYEVWDKNLNGYVQFNDYADAVRYCNDNYINIINIWSVIKNI